MNTLQPKASDSRIRESDLGLAIRPSGKTKPGVSAQEAGLLKTPSVTPYVAVHAGSRDGYQVALALEEAGRLQRLVTDYYDPSAPRWLRWLLRKIPATKGSARRFSRGLAGARVQNTWFSFLVCLVDRTGRHAFLTPLRDKLLGRAAARAAKATGASMLSYSYYAASAFSGLAAEARKVLFLVSPHPAAVRRILMEEIALFPTGRHSLSVEQELNLPDAELALLAGEAHLADFIITPSTFAQESLIAEGIPVSRIRVVPYGVDPGVFPPRRTYPHSAGPLRLIFVGALVQRKGLGYLFEAVRQLPPNSVEIILVARGFKDEALMKAYQDIPVRLLWNEGKEGVLRELQRADVFVFPSLVESFALVLLEAMSVGLPVITTCNTAGPDIMRDGVDGFVGPIRDVDFLVQKIRYFLADRSRVAVMGAAAQERAGQWTWARFRAGVNAALADFEKEARP